MTKYLILFIFLFSYLILIFAERDYYEVLGLSRDASEADIKKAYKKLAIQYHPDKNKEEGAEQKFMEVTNAYQILSDPENRKKYDQFGHAAFNGGSGGGGGGQGMKFNFGDPFQFFNSFFGGGFNGGFSGENIKFSFGGNGAQFGGFGSNFGQQQQTQPPPQKNFYEKNSEISLLDEENFKFQILENGNIWVVQFFTKECKGCQDFVEIYEKVGGNLKNIINFGAVNCGKNKKICESYGVSIRGEPVVLLFPYGKENRQNYKTFSGEKKENSLYEFAVSALPQNHVTVLKYTADYSQFLEIPKPKIILYSKKNSVSPLFLSLSLLFKDFVKFGFVSKNSPIGVHLEADHEISKWPEIIGFSGNLEEKKIYEGEISYPALSFFLNQILKWKKKSSEEIKFPLVDKAKFSSICTSKNLCGIFLLEPEKTDFTEEEKIEIKKILEKILREKPNFVGFYVNNQNSQKIRYDLGENISFLIFNPKTQKIVTTFSATDQILAFVQSAFGGGEKWVKMEGFELEN